MMTDRDEVLKMDPTTVPEIHLAGHLEHKAPNDQDPTKASLDA
jgi:uncharacterized protein (UPF0276 family)